MSRPVVPLHFGEAGGKRRAGRAPIRAIAMVCATGWAYAATAAVLTEHLALVGPCAVGFVIALFVAQSCEPLDCDFVNVFHGSQFSAIEPLNTTQLNSETL